MTPIEEQAVATVENFKRELETNGLTPAADAMWAHALRLKELRDRGQTNQEKPS